MFARFSRHQQKLPDWGIIEAALRLQQRDFLAERPIGKPNTKSPTAKKRSAGNRFSRNRDVFMGKRLRSDLFESTQGTFPSRLKPASRVQISVQPLRGEVFMRVQSQQPCLEFELFFRALKFRASSYERLINKSRSFADP